MRIPTTGIVGLDIFLGVILLIFGMFLVFQKGNKLGWVVVGATGIWLYSTIAPIFNF